MGELEAVLCLQTNDSADGGGASGLDLESNSYPIPRMVKIFSLREKLLIYYGEFAVIDYECPHCNERLTIDDEYAGLSGTCKHCGNYITAPGGFVPSPSQINDPPDLGYEKYEPGAKIKEAIESTGRIIKGVVGIVFFGAMMVPFMFVYLYLTEFSGELAPGAVSERPNRSTTQVPVEGMQESSGGLTGPRGNAVRSAKSYLSHLGFSCKGLIKQLSSDYGDGYTESQANYGARQAGAC